MSQPTPPSPPIISQQGGREDADDHRKTSRSHHRTTRDYRASRSRSRGRVRLTSDRRQNQRSYSKSRSRESNRYHQQQVNRRQRRDRSRSRSRLRNDRSDRSDRRRRNSQRSRSRSHTKSSCRPTHRSRSRSRSRRRNDRSRSRSKDGGGSRSHSSRHEDRHSGSRSSATKQPNVIVLSTESYRDSLKSSNRPTSSIQEEVSNSSNTKASTSEPTPSWKFTKCDQVGVYSNLEPDEPIDKEKIHKEIEEKLRLALAKEGKVYPYPKPEPSHPVFANDGSFLEIFKKMQQQQTFVQQQVGESVQIHAVPAASVPPVMPTLPPQQPPPPQLPVFGRRRGGKILKTGVVAKPKAQNEMDSGDVKDFWSIYLREVKKYKSTACESESKTRPLVR